MGALLYFGACVNVSKLKLAWEGDPLISPCCCFLFLSADIWNISCICAQIGFWSLILREFRSKEGCLIVHDIMINSKLLHANFFWANWGTTLSFCVKFSVGTICICDTYRLVVLTSVDSSERRERQRRDGLSSQLNLSDSDSCEAVRRDRKVLTRARQWSVIPPDLPQSHQPLLNFGVF